MAAANFFMISLPAPDDGGRFRSLPLRSFISSFEKILSHTLCAVKGIRWAGIFCGSRKIRDSGLRICKYRLRAALGFAARAWGARGAALFGRRLGKVSVAIRHDDLRRRNRGMVISAVRRAGQPSRTEIAAATGLSHSTISAISSDLIAQRILRETRAGGPASLRRGRPQVALALEPEAAVVVAAVL
jgi:hypothetical protein